MTPTRQKGEHAPTPYLKAMTRVFLARAELGTGPKKQKKTSFVSLS